jgi:hypothetical protein
MHGVTRLWSLSDNSGVDTCLLSTFRRHNPEKVVAVRWQISEASREIVSLWRDLNPGFPNGMPKDTLRRPQGSTCICSSGSEAIKKGLKATPKQ